MTVKDAASASLTNIYRKQEQVNKALKMGEQQANKTQKAFEKMSKGIKGIGDNVKKLGGGASGGLQSAMTSGGSGMIQRIPGLGALFGAAQSAVESAAQEFVSGLSTSKNIALLSTNFAAGFGKGLNQSIYRSRDRMAAYTKLTDVGVDADLIKNNQGTLEQFAKSQGHGSMEEAVNALASGNIKQGRGLTKSEIDLIKAYSELIGNAHTASTGLELVAGVLKGAEKRTQQYSDAMGKVVEKKDKKGNKYLSATGTAGLIQTEGNVQTTEENYQMQAANMLAPSYGPMVGGRLADLKMRAKAAPLAQKMSKIQTGATEVLLDTIDDFSSGNTGGKQVPQILMEKAYQKITGKAEGGPVAAGQMYQVGEHGRELFMPNANGRIISSQETKRMGGKSGTTIINNITVPLQGFADILERETIKAMNKAGRTILPMHLGVQPRG